MKVALGLAALLVLAFAAGVATAIAVLDRLFGGDGPRVEVDQPWGHLVS